MSLNFDLSKIPEDVRTYVATEDDPRRGIKVGDRLMSGVTNTLIWSTISVGIGEISDKTVDEFFARLDLLQTLDGPMMNGWDSDTEEWVPVKVTREDVVAHMGLSTNVWPMETRTKWVARHVTKNRQLFAHAEPKG